MANPLYDGLIRANRETARPFLMLADGSAISFAAFDGLCARIAGVLAARGVRPGDRVAVQAPKTPEVLALYFACMRIGAVFLPLNTAYTPSEIAFFLTDAEPRLFVCDTAAEGGYRDLTDRLGIALMTISADRGGSLPDAVRRASPRADIADRGPDDLAAQKAELRKSYAGLFGNN